MSTTTMQPISSAAPTSPGSATPQPSANASSLANESVFLQLLVAQLENQDPENPASGTEFVTQLAQFTTLQEDMQSANDLDQIVAGVNALAKALPATPAAPTATAAPSGSGA